MSEFSLGYLTCPFCSYLGCDILTFDREPGKSVYTRDFLSTFWDLRFSFILLFQTLVNFLFVQCVYVCGVCMFICLYVYLQMHMYMCEG